MYQGQFVFSQIMAHLPWKTFHRCVSRCRGDRRIRTFSCAQQYRAMAVAQLNRRSSLRNLVICLRSHRDKLYHLGLSGGVYRNTLAKANEKRDWRIHADYAQHLIDLARPLYSAEDSEPDLQETVYALDLLNHRHLPFAVSVGAVPQDQGRHQAAYPAGSARQHPVVH